MMVVKKADLLKKKPLTSENDEDKEDLESEVPAYDGKSTIIFTIATVNFIFYRLEEGRS